MIKPVVFRPLMLLSASLALSFLVACRPPGQNADGSPHFTAEERNKIFSLSPLPAPPANPSNRYADNPEAAHFGQYLFFDPRLSKNQQISCASCHNPGLGWSDGLPLAKGLGTGTRHSPSLWNVAQQRWLFWDGRADSLWSQALGPIQHPLEMGADAPTLIQRFQSSEDLKAGYTHLFGDLPSAKASATEQQRFLSHLGKALEAYERKIVSQESDFDRFVKTLRNTGTSEALSVAAQRGLRLFIGAGQCILCHQGPNFSDGEFHNIGLPQLSTGTAPDPGRSLGIGSVKTSALNGRGPFSDASAQDPWNDKLNYVSADAAQTGAFRTPSLREVASTAPYMHDGRFQNLQEVLAFYNAPVMAPAIGNREDTLRPLQLTPEDMADLEAFLQSLSSGPPDERLTHQPSTPVLSAAAAEGSSK